jgi:hypothetical protein
MRASGKERERKRKKKINSYSFIMPFKLDDIFNEIFTTATNEIIEGL